MPAAVLFECGAKAELVISLVRFSSRGLRSVSGEAGEAGRISSAWMAVASTRCPREFLGGSLA